MVLKPEWTSPRVLDFDYLLILLQRRDFKCNLLRNTILCLTSNYCSIQDSLGVIYTLQWTDTSGNNKQQGRNPENWTSFQNLDRNWSCLRIGVNVSISFSQG